MAPERVLRSPRRSETGRYAVGINRPRSPVEHRPEVAAPVKQVGPRPGARVPALSLETVRAVARALDGERALT